MYPIKRHFPCQLLYCVLHYVVTCKAIEIYIRIHSHSHYLHHEQLEMGVGTYIRVINE